MKENTRRIAIFGVLGLLWISIVIHMMAPTLGLSNPVFPRPQPDYELYSMLLSGFMLVVYSLKTGIGFLRQNQ